MILTRAHRFALLGIALLGTISQSVLGSDLIASSTRGALTYSKYCALCHGPSGKGDGRAAGLQKKRPADLTSSVAPYEDKLAIVRDGGAAVNRSASMPAWNEVLSAQEILDVLAFVESISRSSSSASSTASSVTRKP